MSSARRIVKVFVTVAGVMALTAATRAQQSEIKFSDPSTLPNPYRLEKGWPTLPKSMNGGHWGELIRVDTDPKGNIWVYHRCFNTEPEGAATCVGRTEPPILQFDKSGKLLKSFGGGMFAFPHGFTVDAEGNVWASDANAGQAVLGKPAIAAEGPFKGQKMGGQVFKFSPDGKVLLTLGKPGVAGSGNDVFDRPTGVAVLPDGTIFVSDGHGRNDRVMKFAKDGTFIKSFGRHGSGPGEFDQPHDINFDSQGRVFVADRNNNRVQILDREGNFIASWKQFGRPSGIYIKNDVLYVSDSHSNSKLGNANGRGIYVGSARDGKVTAFIPDPDGDQADVNRISGASGICADDEGNVYAADVGTHNLRKYVKVK
jgi:DNA-binding beta-propeller fold protein YncE